MDELTLAEMDRLKMDSGIRSLVAELWKHNYQNLQTCDGHGLEAYVSFTEGDGWFEDNASKYGLSKVENGDCCIEEFEAEVRKFDLDPKDFVDRRKSCGCGAGVNGYSAYGGTLIAEEEE